MQIISFSRFHIGIEIRWVRYLSFRPSTFLKYYCFFLVCSSRYFPSTIGSSSYIQHIIHRTINVSKFRYSIYWKSYHNGPPRLSMHEIIGPIYRIYRPYTTRPIYIFLYSFFRNYSILGKSWDISFVRNLSNTISASVTKSDAFLFVEHVYDPWKYSKAILPASNKILLILVISLLSIYIEKIWKNI